MTRRTVALLLTLAACQRAAGSGPQAGATSPPSAAGRVIDSLLPIEEEIRRFREAVPEVPARLTGAESSRDALVRRWAAALEERDSAALGSMLINPAEFITFYYPESRYARPPYRQKPGLRWFLMINSSSRGLAGVWRRYAGTPLPLKGHRCEADPEIVGKSRVWSQCRVQLQAGNGTTTEARLFGAIIERDGWFKFLTY